MRATTLFEVIIIGGSYAGLSAAMTLGRSLRNTLVIDSGKPCNQQTPHSHNFLTQDGKPPEEIVTVARKQVEQYEKVQFLNDKVISGNRVGQLFTLETSSGKTFSAKKLIFATGIKDTMPPVKGFSACWGITAIHCPYCHGFEFRGKKTAIMANGDGAFHVASLVSNLTKNITLLTSGKANFSEEQMHKFHRNNIRIEEAEIAELEHTKGYLNQVVFKDGKKIKFAALYANIPFEQHSNVPAKMGCRLTEMGYIEVDNAQKTSVEGIFACGDNTTYFRSIANAVSNGNIAGATVNYQLVEAAF